MPWPAQFGSLLARPESRASQALRWGLRGFRAVLQAACDESPFGPDSEELRGLLAELDPLLGPSSSGAFLPSDTPVTTLAAPTGAEAEPSLPTSPLSSLVQAVAADGRFREALSRTRFRDGQDDETWNEVQRLFLRYPAELAKEWRLRAAQMAEQAGGQPSDSLARQLPLPDAEVIYPGLTGKIEADGLRSSPSAPLDPRLTKSIPAELRELPGFVSTALWFIDHDPHLCHCLKRVFRFGIVSLSGAQREQYVAEMLRLWERVIQAFSGAAIIKEQIKSLLDLDEALHSLVYQPLADPESWWGRLQAQVRELVFQARDRAVAAGCQAHLQRLGGSFADINRLAPDSLQVDFGVCGEVSACLRLWARIDGEEIKGRVLYRSPLDETAEKGI
jgi:hypothetical protein